MYQTIVSLTLPFVDDSYHSLLKQNLLIKEIIKCLYANCKDIFLFESTGNRATISFLNPMDVEILKATYGHLVTKHV